MALALELGTWNFFIGANILTHKLITIILILLALVPVLARDYTALPFASTPANPSLQTMVSPRCVSYNAANKQLYVADTGLRRIVSFALDGTAQQSWSFAALGIAEEASIPPDSLLPSISLVATKDGISLVWADRQARKLRVIPVENILQARTVTLPADAASGAFTLNSAGLVVLVDILRADGGQLLFLQRETADGGWQMISQRNLPAHPAGTSIYLTGFATNAADNYFVGLAQTPAEKNGSSFARSWLARGTGEQLNFVKNNDITTLLAHHPFATAAEKACVPLFTSLAVIGDTVISGGHSLDPYIRIYSGDAFQLIRTIPFGNGIGGQHLTIFPTDDGNRLAEVSPTAGQLLLYAPDGRRLATIGEAIPFVLDRPEAITANANGVYTAARWNESWHVSAFAPDGTFHWSTPVTPPAGMAQARPVLCAVSPTTILLGWRQPGSTGVGWLVQLDIDGTISAWFPASATPVTDIRISNAGATAAPIVLGADDRIYVLSETKDGTFVQAYTQNGLLVQTYPAEVKGISLALANGSILWANIQQGDMAITGYSHDGMDNGWSSTHRSAPHNALFYTARTPRLWGWLTSTDSLLRMDDTGTVLEEATIISLDGERLHNVLGLASDGKDKLYFALPGKILSLSLK